MSDKDVTKIIFFSFLLWDVKYPKEIAEFGVKVKQLREQAQLSQQDLADEADISKRTIQRIEKAQYGATLDVIFAISYALKVQPTELFSS